MDTFRAFAMGEANRGKPPMVFDWNKAARLIVERKPSVVSAGLQSDWGYTGGTIYRNGEPVYEYTYLASTWAIPEIDLDGEVEPCFIMMKESDGWNSDTKWPESALKILNEGK